MVNEDAVKMRKHILNCVEKAAKEHDLKNVKHNNVYGMWKFDLP